jgi:hypothetical protein
MKVIIVTYKGGNVENVIWFLNNYLENHKASYQIK